MINENRNCDGCTSCCEGWLQGQAHGHHYWPGRKCFFLKENGCSIYKDRPQNSCIDYKCAWLLRPDIIPEWMKPNRCNAILTFREVDGIPFIDLTETGKKLDSTVLSWLFFKYQDGTFPNIRYMIEGGVNYFGTKEFLEKITGVVKSENEFN